MHILLVNPWIHDFAAYDFWAKPLGLLQLAALLRLHGCRVSYLDCLDRFHPRAAPVDTRLRHGRGPYLKTPLPTPAGLQTIKRRYCRYGIDPKWFAQDLRNLDDTPEVILVTSLMTYWYTGVQETIGILKRVFPQTPVVLGGIYATLCTAHAKAHAGADHVFSGPAEEHLLPLIETLTGKRLPRRFNPEDLDTSPYPAFDLQSRITYIPLMTSRGCPFKCAYCASHLLQPRCVKRSPTHVADEVAHWHATHGVTDFAFYDDALLTHAGSHAILLLEALIQKNLNLNFHTPNALHIRGITARTAALMKRAGFKTLRLGLETTAFEDRTTLDRKVTADEFKQAVAHLKAAGFKRRQIGAYLLVGLPHQSVKAVERSIRTVQQAGIKPVPAYYTPIAGTALWPEAQKVSRYDLAADPLYTNNAIMPCWPDGFSWEVISRLKELAA